MVSINIIGQSLVAQARGCGGCYPGGTAIKVTGVDRESCPRPIWDETEAELEGASFVSTLAMGAIAATGLLLAVLPVVIALRVLELPSGWVGAGVGSLGAALGGVKLIAMAWAVGARLSAGSPARAAVAAAD